jgi:hypothetical protein
MATIVGVYAVLHTPGFVDEVKLNGERGGRAGFSYCRVTSGARRAPDEDWPQKDTKLRSSKYFNNVVEQDHRKRQVEIGEFPKPSENCIFNLEGGVRRMINTNGAGQIDLKSELFVKVLASCGGLVHSAIFQAAPRVYKPIFYGGLEGDDSIQMTLRNLI